ncbi:uncharacterized protein LOC144096870 [Amblyomma americanum]
MPEKREDGLRSETAHSSLSKWTSNGSLIQHLQGRETKTHFRHFAESEQNSWELIAVLAAGTTAEGPRQETSSAAAGPGYDAAACCEAASAPEPPFLSTRFVAIRPLGIHHCAGATSASSHSERIKPGIECSLVSGRGGTMKKSINDLRTFFVLQLIAVLAAGTTAEGHRQETSAAAGPGYDAAASCEAACAPEPPFLSTGFVAIRPLGIHNCAAAT